MTVKKPGTEAVVAYLGYGGLVPFAALALAALLDPPRAGLWRSALIDYGAVILSFVGALHWGFAMTRVDLPERWRTAMFLWSVVPSLVAWVALLIPPSIALAVLIGGFLTHLAPDRRLVRLGGLPPWYWMLRLHLSAVASLCLGASAWSGHR